MSCPDDQQLKSFVSESLSETDRLHLEQHIHACDDCFKTVASIAQDYAQNAGLALDSTVGAEPISKYLDVVSRTVPPSLLDGRTLAESEHLNLLTEGAMVDHFRVMRLLGRGGMGEVYLARDVQLGRKVALKVIHPDQLVNESLLKRFLFEARTTARFNHPNIVTIYAVGQVSGMPYVALEYLEGQDLKVRMADEVLSLQEALRIILAIGEAVAEAHRHGVLHRDLKPANVLIPRDGRIRVVDFGLAIQTSKPQEEPDDEDIESSQPELDFSDGGGLRGTPAYMAPEQWRRKETTTATDIWALGVILFELCTGRRPFIQKGIRQLSWAVCSIDFVPEPGVLSLFPGEVSELVQRCLSRRPEGRPTAEQFVDVIRETLLDGRRTASLEESPFRGLLPFAERHAQMFFGRESEITSTAERLRHEPGLAIVGPSGAGKTSFVQAGLIPRLRESGRWIVVRVRPGEQPLVRLATKLLAAHAEETGSQPIQNSAERTLPTHHEPMMQEVDADDTRQMEITTLALKFWEHPRQLFLELNALAAIRNARVLLMIDQLEELFTLCPNRDRQVAFMQAVCTAADDPVDPVRVLLTIRDDFLGRMASTGEVARNMLRQVMVLSTPDVDVLEEVLTRPLEAAGYQYDDPQLPSDMVAALDSVASLPLLQFAARSLWDKRDQVGRKLRRIDYDEMGGVEGALARHADEVLQGLSAQELGIARAVLLRMVTPDRTRRVVTESQLQDGLDREIGHVLRRLTQSRLLSVRKADGGTDGEASLELAHESLINNWKLLAEWIEESKEELVFLAEIGQAAELWKRRGRRTEELWTGDALQEALRTQARTATPLPSTVSEFLQAAQLLHRKRTRSRRIWFASVPIVLGVLAFVFALQKYEAEHARDISEQRRALAIEGRAKAEVKEREAQRQRAEVLLESGQASWERGELVKARAKLREALESSPSSFESLRSLWWRLEQDPRLLQYPLGSALYRAVYSPDGRRAAVAAQNGTVGLVNLVTGEVSHLRGHRDQTYTVVFSADGRRIASSGYGGEIKIWDTQHGGEITSIQTGDSFTANLEFTQGDSQLVSSNDRGLIRWWNIETGQQVKSIEDGASSTSNLVAVGDHIIFGSVAKGRARIMKTDGLKTTVLLSKPKGMVLASLINSKGDHVAFTDQNQTLTLWSLSSGKKLVEVNDYLGGPEAMAIDQEDTHLAVATTGHQIKVIRIEDGTVVNLFNGHSEPIMSLDFSPSSDQLLSASMDGTIRSWLLSASRVNAIPWAGHTGAIYGLTTHPDGDRFATAGLKGTLAIWSANQGRETQIFDGPQGTQGVIAFSPNGQFLAWQDPRKNIRIWNLKEKRFEHVLETNGKSFGHLLFHPNGRELITTGDSHVIRWNLQTGRKLAEAKVRLGTAIASALSPDGRHLIAGGANGRLKRVRLGDMKIVGTNRAHTNHVFGVDFINNNTVMTGSWDKGIRSWDLRTGQVSLFRETESRINEMAFDANGRRLATANADGTIGIWPLDDQAPSQLFGHQNEVNLVDFIKGGELVASGGDDTTVRLWDMGTGGPFWRAPAILPDGPVLVSHRGWLNLGSANGKSITAPKKAWARSLMNSTRIAQSQVKDGLLCTVTHQGDVMMWDRQNDKLMWKKKIPKVENVLSHGEHCLVNGGGRALSIDRQGQSQEFETTQPALALAPAPDGILIASDRVVTRFTEQGNETHRYVIGPNPTAIASTEVANQEKLVVGYGDGTIEVYGVAEDGRATEPTVLDRTISSRIVGLRPGPPGLLAAGHADGTIALWDIEAVRRVEKVSLHGSARHLFFTEDRLYVATDLGQYHSWPIGALTKDRCALLKDVWATVPVVWRNGKVIETKEPEAHPCKR